ncbi:MAG: acyl carrier protein [Chryseosolibacter sp.]
MTNADILQLLKTEIARETGVPVSEIADSATFFDLGLNSISAVFILDILEKKLNIEMNPLFFWDYPTVELLAGYITTLGQK